MLDSSNSSSNGRIEEAAVAMVEAEEEVEAAGLVAEDMEVEAEDMEEEEGGTTTLAGKGQGEETTAMSTNGGRNGTLRC